MTPPPDRSPLLVALGGRTPALAPLPEAPARLGARAFGDVADELAAARTGCALWDASDRGEVRVLGDDAAAFVHRITAAGARHAEPGTLVRSLLLSSKGRVLSDFDLTTVDEGARLGTPPGAAPGLAAALDAYHFGERLSIADASADTAPLELSGPTAAELARATLGVVPAPGRVEHATAAWDGSPVTVAAVTGPVGPALRIDAGPAGVLAAFRALVAAGAVPAGLEAREVLRVEAGRGLFGRELDDTVTPQEGGLSPGDGFQLDKGCYVGQEVVAKIDTYGGQNRRVEGLALEGDGVVEPGTPVLTEDGQDAGAVTSWILSPALGSGLALARLKERLRSPSGRYTVGGRPARTVALPLGGA